MDKKISVEEFVNRYLDISDDVDKFEFLKKCIYRTYAPILEKRIVLERLLEKSIRTIDGVKYIDLIISKINISVAIVMLYTNIDVSKSADINNNIFTDYDLLKQNDLLNIISTYIGENEIKELGLINELIIESFYERNKNIYVYMLNICSKLISVFNGLLDRITSHFSNYENMENLKEKIKEVINEKTE